MKKMLFFLIPFLLVLSAYSQPVTTTIPDKSYGAGGSKTVTTTKDEIGEVTVTEIKDSEGKVRELSRTSQEGGGPIIFTQTYYTKSGAKFKTVRQEFDNKKTLISSESKEYVNENVIYSVNRTRKADGTYDVHIEDKEKGKTYDRNEPAGATYIHPPNDFKHPVQKEGCLPKFELYAGYSYLSSTIGDKMEGYPLGAQVTATYVLGKKWGVQLDGSWHSKSKDDFKYNQSYVFAGIQYDFKKEEQCLKDAQWRAVARFLIGGGFFSESYDIMGYGSDKYKDCGPAFGLGGAVELRLSDRFRARLGADYIGTKINDEYNNSFRASGGILFFIDE